MAPCLQKIEEKQREIQEEELRKEKLKQHLALIEKKMGKLGKFEQFLKQVQSKNQEEYPELQDILQRYRTLKDSNERL